MPIRLQMQKTFLISWMLLFPFAFLPNPVAAQTQIREGRVTKAPWLETYRHIEIDGKKYTFMPEAEEKVFRRVDQRGMSFEESISPARVHSGSRVEASVQGFRIYRLLVVP